MEEKKKEIIENLIEDRVKILKKEKERLEDMITKDTAKEQELPKEFLEQRREKLADVIKETKILETDEKQETDTLD